MATIYKICPATLWNAAVAEGVFRGAGIDLGDGFIHFSGADTVRQTAALYFKGVDHLVLVALDDGALGPALKYEASRGGALFPHLYGTFDPALALWAKPLPLADDGSHVFPELPP